MPANEPPPPTPTGAAAPDAEAGVWQTRVESSPVDALASESGVPPWSSRELWVGTVLGFLSGVALVPMRGMVYAGQGVGWNPQVALALYATLALSALAGLLSTAFTSASTSAAVVRAARAGALAAWTGALRYLCGATGALAATPILLHAQLPTGADIADELTVSLGLTTVSYFALFTAPLLIGAAAGAVGGLVAAGTGIARRGGRSAPVEPWAVAVGMLGAVPFVATASVFGLAVAPTLIGAMWDSFVEVGAWPSLPYWIAAMSGIGATSMAVAWIFLVAAGWFAREGLASAVRDRSVSGLAILGLVATHAILSYMTIVQGVGGLQARFPDEIALPDAWFVAPPLLALIGLFGLLAPWRKSFERPTTLWAFDAWLIAYAITQPFVAIPVCGGLSIAMGAVQSIVALTANTPEGSEHLSAMLATMPVCDTAAETSQIYRTMGLALIGVVVGAGAWVSERVARGQAERA